MDGQKLLDANRVELVPFAALMAPPAELDGPAWLRRCVEVIETSSADFAILGGLIYGSETIWNAVLEVTVIESSVIQDLSKKWIAQGVEQGREEGIEQGQKLQARKAILTVLTARFQTDAVERLKLLIGAIDELEDLNQLHLAAAKADSLEDFSNVLLGINTSVQ